MIHLFTFSVINLLRARPGKPIFSVRHPDGAGRNYTVQQTKLCQALLVCLIAPLSRRCRCGRHAHVAGCGTGSRQDSASAARTPRGEGSGAASRRRSSVHISATAGTPAHDGGSWQCRPDQIAIVPTARAKRAAVLELGNSAEPSTCVVADGLGLGKRL